MSAPDSKTEPVDIIDMIMLIKQRVSDLSDTERKEIYQIIYSSSIESDKIQEKGSGIQIKFKDIPRSAISDVYYYITRKLAERMQQLENCTEENVSVTDDVQE